MKPKFRLLISALILVYGICISPVRSDAQIQTTQARSGNFSEPGQPSQWSDVTLLDSRTNTNTNRKPGNDFDFEKEVWNLSEAELATMHVTLLLAGAGLKPVTCEIRSACRIVFESDKAGQKVHYSPKTGTYSGGVRIELSIRDKPCFDIVAEEVKLDIKCMSKGVIKGSSPEW